MHEITVEPAAVVVAAAPALLSGGIWCSRLLGRLGTLIHPERRWHALTRVAGPVITVAARGELIVAVALLLPWTGAQSWPEALGLAGLVGLGCVASVALAAGGRVGTYLIGAACHLAALPVRAIVLVLWT